jgi:hypothetical protein
MRALVSAPRESLLTRWVSHEKPTKKSTARQVIAMSDRKVKKEPKVVFVYSIEPSGTAVRVVASSDGKVYPMSAPPRRSPPLSNLLSQHPHHKIL